MSLLPLPPALPIPHPIDPLTRKLLGGKSAESSSGLSEVANAIDPTGLLAAQLGIGKAGNEALKQQWAELTKPSLPQMLANPAGMLGLPDPLSIVGSLLGGGGGIFGQLLGGGGGASGLFGSLLG